MSTSRASLVWTALALVAAGAGGCGASSASFPYDREIVWRAVVAEAVAWRPTLIDDQKQIIRCERSDLAGAATEYEARAGRDWNLFAPRPSATVTVSMKQTKPTKLRFRQLEQEFLLAVAGTLQAASQPRNR